MFTNNNLPLNINTSLIKSDNLGVSLNAIDIGDYFPGFINTVENLGSWIVETTWVIP